MGLGKHGLLIIIILCWANVAIAATLRVPSEYATIQEAIDIAGDGDIVLVADGIYTGENNKNLTWDGAEKHIIVTSENGPDNCIIDCEDDGIGFYFDRTNQNNNDVVNGFTIKFLKPYLEHTLANLNCDMHGHLNIKGALASPELYGALKVANGQFRIDYLSTDYALNDSIQTLQPTLR